MEEFGSAGRGRGFPLFSEYFPPGAAPPRPPAPAVVRARVDLAVDDDEYHARRPRRHGDVVDVAPLRCVDDTPSFAAVAAVARAVDLQTCPDVVRLDRIDGDAG